jgi:alpha-ketoglutarate-dependent 2,4-dichlorophenoxyacetate dioxygenase
MPVAAGRKLLAALYEFTTQAKYVYTHAWRSGDLIVWDNRRALHRASPWQDNGQIRDMRRTTLLERGPEISATSRY